MGSLLFYTIAIAGTSGIFFRSFFDTGYAGTVFCVVVASVSLCAWFTLTDKTNYRTPLFLSFLALMSCGLGMLRMHIAEETVSPLQKYAGEQVVLIGQVVREPEIRPTTLHLSLRVSGDEGFSDDIVLVSLDKYLEGLSTLSYGDIVSVSGLLSLPEPFVTDSGRSFDYRGYLKAQGISYTVSYAEAAIIEEEEGTLFGYLFAGKSRFLHALRESIPDPYVGLGEGVLLGVKQALPPDLEETFRQSGIIHIVVLSGYNIMIVVSCVMYVLSHLFFPKTRMIIGISIVILFAICVGLSATVVRASVMALLLLLAQGFGRRYVILRALTCAGVGMLLLNPYLLVYDPGFQLSFIATLGLILCAPYIESKLSRIPGLFGVREFLTATLATQLCVLPLLLYHTGQFSVVSVAVNVLVLPMVPVAMMLTFLTGVLTLLSETLGFIVGYGAYISLGYIINVAELSVRIPFSTFTIGTFPFVVVVGLYAVLAIWVYAINTYRIIVPKPKDTQSGVVNEYADWVIETVPTKNTGVVVETRNDSTFPFR